MTGGMNNILDRAQTVLADRESAYGDPRVNAEIWAQIASAATGVQLRPEHYPVVMVAVKLARLRSGWHEDSWLDIAGYAGVAEMIEGACDPDC